MLSNKWHGFSLFVYSVLLLFWLCWVFVVDLEINGTNASHVTEDLTGDTNAIRTPNESDQTFSTA